MVRAVLLRLALIPVTLFGVALLTFLLLDLVPLDRAEAQLAGSRATREESRRIEAVRELRVRYGLVDPVTGARYDVLTRFGHWLGHAARFDFAPPGLTKEEFRDRVVRALSTSMLLGTLALLLVLAVGVPLGWWLGLRVGSLTDRAASTALLGLGALPEFLTATLLILLFSGPLRSVLPSGGLRSSGADALSPLGQVFDLLRHLALPVGVLAIGPTAWLTRLLRASCSRTARAPFVHAMRALGATEREINVRILRNSLGPVWTFLGVLLPWIATGAIVVESVFGIRGFGRFALDAIRERDVSTVMVSTLLVAAAVALGSLCGDLMHRRADPRVVLR